MKTHLHHILLSAMLLLVAIKVEAQVGINNPNPHVSAVLDLSSTSKGLLIPRMSTANRVAINAPAPGLLVYDTDDNMYYTYHPDGYWGALNPYNFRDGATFRTHPRMTDMNLFEVSNGNQADVGNSPRLWVDGQLIVAGTFERPPGAYGLMVEGASRFKETVTFDKTPTFTEGLPAPSGNIGAIVDNGAAPDTYNTTFQGYGTIPLGGIIMWSGNPAALPPGWAICDGVQPSPVPNDELGNAIVVPDLRERFIVGAGVAGATDNPTVRNLDGSTDGSGGYEYGEDGGYVSDTLNLNNIPSHSHDISHGHTINDPGHEHSFPLYDANNNDTGTDDAGGSVVRRRFTDRSTTGITVNSFNGNSQPAGNINPDPIDTRPPYYALAFIIRVQ